MRDPAQDTLQKTLMFEPHLGVSLPETVQNEAVGVFALLQMGRTSVLRDGRRILVRSPEHDSSPKGWR